MGPTSCSLRTDLHMRSRAPSSRDRRVAAAQLETENRGEGKAAGLAALHPTQLLHDANAHAAEERGACGQLALELLVAPEQQHHQQEGCLLTAGHAMPAAWAACARMQRGCK
jgi:hypothetical protein